MRDFANGRAENWLQGRAAEVCLAVALSPAFAWMAPFGVDEGSFFERLAFWGGLLSCWFLVLAATDARFRTSRFLDPLPAGARQVALIGLAALPMIGVTAFAVNNMEGWEFSVAEVAELYVQIIIIGTGVTLLGKALLTAPVQRELPSPAMLQPMAADEDPALAPAAIPSSPALMTRLPPATRGSILCLQMEDHYVRVHTSNGSALILLRLSDAIAETTPVAGRQVHRSWWVSDAAVENFEKLGRVGALQLSNGVRAPVSQRYLRDVQTVFDPAS